MKFSNVDVIGNEEYLLESRKERETKGVFGRIFNAIIYPKNPKYTFCFYMPKYIYLRSVSFCDEVEEEVGGEFNVSDLARVLYDDFLEYVKNFKNDINEIHNIYSRLKARSLNPTRIIPFSTDEVYEGVIFKEHRGFELIKVKIEHKDALRGELLLRDMLEIYPEHGFILENVLEIIYYDFIEDFRKFLIKNPVQKIAQYI